MVQALQPAYAQPVLADAQDDREKVQEREADEEPGNRQPEERDRARNSVADASRTPRARDPERNGDKPDEEERRRRHKDRPAEAASAAQRGRGGKTRLERQPEVASRDHANDPAPVPLEHRSLEAEALAKRRDRLRRQVGVRFEPRRRVAGHGVDQQEPDERHGKDHRHDHEDAPHDEPDEAKP